jgi:hypothetical protein
MQIWGAASIAASDGLEFVVQALVRSQPCTVQHLNAGFLSTLSCLGDDLKRQGDRECRAQGEQMQMKDEVEWNDLTLIADT